jgi:nondiscriminating aspartyl-tRNA synthetase
VRLSGWVHSRRDLGALSFLVLRDRGGLAQIVSSEPLDLVPETVIEVEGQVVAAGQAPAGVELDRTDRRSLAS